MDIKNSLIMSLINAKSYLLVLKVNFTDIKFKNK